VDKENLATVKLIKPKIEKSLNIEINECWTEHPKFETKVLKILKDLNKEAHDSNTLKTIFP
jgi:hypothetical protein